MTNLVIISVSLAAFAFFAYHAARVYFDNEREIRSVERRREELREIEVIRKEIDDELAKPSPSIPRVCALRARLRELGAIVD